MSNKFLLVCLMFFYCSCKTAAENTGDSNATPATKPGTCNIKGKIVEVLEPSSTDTGSICSKYPCKAKVKILELYGCGSAVSLPVNNGDVMEMSFAYTLHSTEIIPGMKTHFPGLKKGSVFTANATQRLIMGKDGEFVIYDYEAR